MDRLHPTHRARRENDIIRRREKQFCHDEMWSGAEKYFKFWEKNNSMYDAWTSPRYYTENNKLVSEIKTQRDKEELLEKRREKLRKFLLDEDRSFEIELTVHKSKLEAAARTKPDDIPTVVLREVNSSLKLEEEEKRRHEAEMKLYHQWRNNNPIVRNYERKYGYKEIKMSWLDQQIERRMQKDKEEEECKKFLKDREERLKKQAEKDAQFKKDAELKRKQLQDTLDLQLNELKLKHELSEQLKKNEEEEMRKKTTLLELKQKQLDEEKRRLDREVALTNIKQHKQKLKQKILDVQENLEYEKLVVQALNELQLEDIIADMKKRDKIKESLTDFLALVKEQQALEKKRQSHLDFIFDSEAQLIFEKQSQLWHNEEGSRQTLLKNVLDTVKTQIDLNLEKNKKQQMEILKEKEQMVEKLESLDKEMKLMQEVESKKQLDRRMGLDDELKVKAVKKKQQENFKLKKMNEELERVKKEEERLKLEILRIQGNQRPVRPLRSRPFY